MNSLSDLQHLLLAIIKELLALGMDLISLQEENGKRGVANFIPSILPPFPPHPNSSHPHPCFEQSLGFISEAGSDLGQHPFLEVTVTLLVAESITAGVVPLSQLLDKIVNL